MSRKGNPYDNAKMESFMATLKLEEVELSEYENFFEVQAEVSKFIDAVYNVKRLHSSLGYVPPTEFELAYHERMKLEVSALVWKVVSVSGCSPVRVVSYSPPL